MSFNPEFDSGGGGTDGSEDVDSSPDPGVDTTTETTDIDVGKLLNRQRQTTDSRTETQEDTEVDFRDIGGDPVDSGGEPDISGPGPNGDVMDEDIGSAGETDVRPDSGTQEGPTADDLTIPDSPTDAAETTDTMDGRVFESVSEFEQTIEQQTGREISQGDEFTIENGSIRFSGAFLASVSRERAREAGRDLTEPASGPFQFDVEGGVPALASGGLEVGTGFFDEPELEPVMQPTDISGLELGDVVAEERQETREDLERQLEQQVGTDLGPGDIEFQEEDGQITATLSEAGERRVQIDRAPIVGAAETLGVFEPEARDVAGAAVTFREFRQEQRERFVEPSLQSLREATGLEEEIETFESFRDQAAAAEEEFLEPARQLVSDQVPAGLAAGAVAVGTRGASLTPPGRLAVGAGLATAAAVDVFKDLPPEQQLEIATAVGTASAPVQRAQQALTGPDFDSPTVRADIPSALPDELDAPERPEPLFDRELPATSGPFFVSELDVPLGRPTLQEIPVGEGVLPQPLTLERPDEPTEGAAGGAEVPIDIEDGEVTVGPAEAGEAIQRERPAPTVPADPMGETVSGRELEEATGRLERQRQIDERIGRRQQGVEAGEGLVLQRILQEPLQDELERLDAATAAEVLSEPAPVPMPPAAAPVADVSAAQATETAMQQDFRMDFDLDTRIDTRFDLPTVQTTEFARPLEFAEPTIEAPAFETAFGTGVATPRVATGELPLPAITLESDESRRRERDFEEFEREFLEPVISPTEALEADRGGPEVMNLSDDMT